MKHSSTHSVSVFFKPWNVIFLDHCARMGGGEIALLHLVEELDVSRVRPFVLLGEEGLLRLELERTGVDCQCLHIPVRLNGIHRHEVLRKGFCEPSSLPRLLKTSLCVARHALMKRALLLHCNSLKADVIGGIAGKMANVRVVWHMRDRLHAGYMPHAVCRIFRSLSHIIPDGVIANSCSTMLSLFPEENVASAPSLQCREVIHDGVPLSAFVLQRPVRRDCELTVGMIGRIAPWKGQRVFIEAAKEIHSRFPEVRFEIVGGALFGEEDYEREISDMVTGESSEYIRFLGYLPNPAEVMRGFDVLVHASIIGEPFGQVVIEAMASGIPVVATNGGGIPEIITHGENGLLAEMGNFRDLANCMEMLITDPDLRAELAKSGRECVLERFTACRVARKVEMFYDHLLNASD
jgi:glycosyltransferase involved in cell wall biosynthesis